MTDYEIFELPLYSEPSYSYNYVIEKQSYTFRFYYNTLMECWIYNIGFSDGEDIILGRRLVPNAPLTERYAVPWDGFFALFPIGDNRLETISNPYEIYKYYKLHYFSPITEEREDG